MSSRQSRGRGDRGSGGRGRGDSQRGSSRGRGDGIDRGGPSGGRGRGDDGYRGGGQRGDRGSDGPARGDGYRGGRARGGGPMQMTSRPARVDGSIYLDGQQVSPPEADVRAREDALVVETKGKMIDGFPARSGYGTSGREVTLRTNYFKITTAYEANQQSGNDKLHRYDIDFAPDLTRLKRQDIVTQLMRDPIFNDVHWATDYGKYIVTTSQLDFGGRKEWTKKFTVTPPSGDSQESQGQAPQFVQQAQRRNTATVKLVFNRTYSLSDMIEYLRSVSPGAQYLGNEDLIQMLNIVLCKPTRASATVAPVGQNKFYPFHGDPLAEIFNLGGALQAIRGYYSSVRPTIGRLLVNINVTSGAFYEPIALTTVMNMFIGRGSELAAFLKGVKVEARYIRDRETAPYMTKTKTIFGLLKQTNPQNPQMTRYANAHQATFDYTDTTVTPPVTSNVSVFNYFKNVRGITISHTDWPVLNVATARDPQFIPAEICTILPGQAYRALLPPDQTSEMITFAARYPNANAMSIAGTANAPGNGLILFGLASRGGGINTQANTVQPFGFRIDQNMLTVPGRILQPPKITYAAGAKDVRSGSWNLAKVKFRQGGKFDSWQVMVINTKREHGQQMTALFDPPREGLAPEPLFNALGQALTSYGIRLGNRAPTRVVNLEPLTRNQRQNNDRSLEQAFKAAKEQGKSKVILVVLPQQDRWLYSRIKFYADVQFGLHTINAIGKNLQKERGQDMFFANLALKFNVKGGGVAHEVPNTLSGPVGDNTIIFGIDVTHPSPNSAKGAPSIACVVANTNKTLFHWPGSIRSQTGRQEMVDNLKDMVMERIKLWRKKNEGRLPDRVVIYRDGVSEGQFKLVLEHELPPFQAAYKELYGAEPKWPKTAIIIVGKRHHTRFYPTKQEDADVYVDQRTKQIKGSWNTQPGTVVDRSIVGRVIREFYLQAHQGLQGTVKPAHYSVIKDDVGFTADQLERFTLNLCYYFARCTRAVSVCPPAYYADLLAERGRAYLYTTLQESHADDASSISSSQAEWQGGVHADIAESTWYI